MKAAITSISPKNLDKQFVSVDSWINLGFKVYSVNHVDEIKVLKDKFTNVNFIGSKNVMGDSSIPYVSINDIIKLALKQDHPAWILNSDIILKVENPNIIDSLNTISNDGLVFGNRIDIESYDSPKGKFYEHGFDYFIINKNFEHIFRFNTGDSLYMGQPWWDFWLPINFIRKGIKPIKYEGNIAYHLEHEIAWDIDQLYLMGMIFSKKIGFKSFNRSEMPSFTEITWNTIDKNCIKLKEKDVIR